MHHALRHQAGEHTSRHGHAPKDRRLRHGQAAGPRVQPGADDGEGTIGYLAPEWITGSAITPKADVYSFGLMLHEIVSGRRNTDTCAEWNRIYFPLWAAIKLQEGETLCLLDPRLKGEADAEELSRVCRVACWCIQDLECSRPSMGEVVQQLEGVLDVSIPPIPALLKNLVDDESGENNHYTTTI
ncbi:serine threonine-protein kinase [Musa troglodytarum]|uniref:Serine threonine-protein kinase n=1 Tax=Musa troglodytarum TaxID=320322 RepID=A0A9E7J8Q8_9LILI|nr:serine threonine-protein kinase [Musa troglodytarum]